MGSKTVERQRAARTGDDGTSGVLADRRGEFVRERRSVSATLARVNLHRQHDPLPSYVVGRTHSVSLTAPTGRTFPAAPLPVGASRVVSEP